jgi:hypothetical protein
MIDQALSVQFTITLVTSRLTRTLGQYKELQYTNAQKFVHANGVLLTPRKERAHQEATHLRNNLKKRMPPWDQ